MSVAPHDSLAPSSSSSSSSSSRSTVTNEPPPRGPLAPPPALRDRLLAEIAAEKAPTRAELRLRLALLAATTLVFLVPMAMRGLRRDFHELPMVYGLGTVAIVGAAAGSLLSLALARGKAMMGPRTTVLVAAALSLPLLVLTWLLFSPTTTPLSAAPSGADALRAIAVCDGMALALAFPPLLAALSYRRVFVARSPALVGAMIGAAAGCISHVGVHLHCSVTTTSHLMLGHFLPLIPLALVGAFWLSRRRS
jgi:hypothetical protein